jgi:hypothetical protein
MSCELCGGGDEWIKTCHTPEGSRLLVCDECYEENSSVLVIVPGDRVVRPAVITAGATAILVTSWRSALEDARTPTRGRALRVRGRWGRDGTRGAAPSSRLPAGQERSRPLGVAS